jgi:hypothetical protein
VRRRLLLFSLPLLALLGACVLALAIAVPRRDPGAHHINVQLGELRLLGYLTMIPRCSPEGPCPQATAMAAVADREYFVVWLLYPRQVGATRMTAGRRLLTIPLLARE